MTQIPSQGRMVRYVIGFDHTGKPATCAAVVVRAWSDKPDSACNLQVFVDGSNDSSARAFYRRGESGIEWSATGGEGWLESKSAVPSANEAMHGLMWRTSVAYSEDKRPGTWHWPERV